MKKLYVFIILMVFTSLAIGANMFATRTVETEKAGHFLEYGKDPDGNIVPKKVDSEGAGDVNVQDQHTPPIDTYFARSISNFTLSADTTASTETILEYEFEATAGHGIVLENEIILLDVTANKSFFAVVTNVATNTITVDRPIDHLFPSATTLGRIVSTNMAVDGSVTPVVFSIRAGTIPTDFVKFGLTMTDNSPMDYSLFGGLPKLDNGLVFRIVDSFQETIYCFKTNGEMSDFSFESVFADKAPAGEYGYNVVFTFGGQDNHGVVLRISEGDVIQWIVQDDLTGLLTFRGTGLGHETKE